MHILCFQPIHTHTHTHTSHLHVHAHIAKQRPRGKYVYRMRIYCGDEIIQLLAGLSSRAICTWGSRRYCFGVTFSDACKPETAALVIIIMNRNNNNNNNYSNYNKLYPGRKSLYHLVVYRDETMTIPTIPI